MTYSFSKRVLGIKIDDISLSEALRTVSTWTAGTGKMIVTPGPEFLLTAQKDAEFAKILNEADLSLPDGFGLHLAGIKNRVPGTDLMAALCQLSAQKGWTIGLIGGQTGVAKKTAEKLKEKFPHIKISLVINGDEATKLKNGSDIDNYIKQGIDILFVGLGHPWQEKVLARSKKWFRVGMGVGGAFDYISQITPRPAKFLRAIGFEWLGRLIYQPWRLRRILNATIVFPIMLLLNRGKIRS